MAKTLLPIVKDQPEEPLDMVEKHIERKPVEKEEKKVEPVEETKDQAITAQCWDSRKQHLKNIKDQAIREGNQDYTGGFFEDNRWKKEEEARDEDGNLKRVEFMKKLKLSSFEALEL